MNVRDFDAALWTYRARFLRVIDGDTFVALVDLPFNIRYEMRVRLAGFSRPERTTPEGRIAAEKMRSLFRSDRYTGAMLETKYWPLRIVTEQLPSGNETPTFERYVATCYLVAEDGEMTNLIDLL